MSVVSVPVVVIPDLSISEMPTYVSGVCASGCHTRFIYFRDAHMY